MMGDEPEREWGDKVVLSNAPPAAQLDSAKDAPPEPSDSSHRLLEDEEIQDKKHTREMRGIYAGKAYKIAKCALAGWAVFLLVAGISNACTGQPMYSDRVVIAVTTGVTVSVLAAFLGVIRGIFPAGNGKR